METREWLRKTVGAAPEFTRYHHIENRPARDRMQADLLCLELLHIFHPFGGEHRRDHAVAGVARSKTDFVL